jgi:hypothetical protein
MSCRKILWISPILIWFHIKLLSCRFSSVPCDENWGPLCSLLLYYKHYERKIKVKRKMSHYMPWRRLEERRYSSYSFLTSTLDGVSGQRHALDTLYAWYQLERRLGGPQSWTGHRGQRKNLLPLPGIKPWLLSPLSDTILTELPRLLKED